MGRRLQLDFGKVGRRILAAIRHLLHLVEDEAIQTSCARRAGDNADGQKSNQSSHDRGINDKIPIEQRRVACGWGQAPLQLQDAAFHQDERRGQ